MTLEIGEDFLLYETVAEIWDAVEKTYSNKEHESELYRLEGDIRKQLLGDMSVIDYYTKLSWMWLQLDMIEKPDWSRTKDVSL